MKLWRVGSKVKINVYEGDRPVCQCHSEIDAARIVVAMNNKYMTDAERKLLEAGAEAAEWLGWADTPRGQIAFRLRAAIAAFLEAKGGAE